MESSMSLPTTNQIIIVGREAIPVPMDSFHYLGYFWSAKLAGILAHKLRANGYPLTPYYVEVAVDEDEISIPRAELFGHSSDVEIYAYYLNDDGDPVKMLPTEWDRLDFRFSTLEQKFRNQEEVPDEKYHEWYCEALKLLPVGVFLWKDDVEALWSAYLSQTSPMQGARPDERRIKYDAFIDVEFRCLIYEGFESFLQEAVVKLTGCFIENELEQQAPEAVISSSKTPNEGVTDMDENDSPRVIHL